MSVAVQIGAALGDLLSTISRASEQELRDARRQLLETASRHSYAMLPIIRSRKKVDRIERLRLEVLRHAFTDAAFLIDAETRMRCEDPKRPEWQ